MTRPRASTRAATGTSQCGGTTGGVSALLDELLDIDKPAWREQAACRGVDPSIFFPPGDSERVKSSVYDRARAVCAACPVRLACLKEHLDEDHGCWGGTSPRERRDLRRQRSVQLSTRTFAHVGDCDIAVRIGA